jgi:hypothetical protein
MVVVNVVVMAVALVLHFRTTSTLGRRLRSKLSKVPPLPPLPRKRKEGRKVGSESRKEVCQGRKEGRKEKEGT